jgi:transposase-like protein
MPPENNPTKPLVPPCPRCGQPHPKKFKSMGKITFGQPQPLTPLYWCKTCKYFYSPTQETPNHHATHPQTRSEPV